MIAPSGRVSAVASATSWPEADGVFRSDGRWLGSDDAYSIELEPRRVLWLFGDSFVGDAIDRSRSSAAFIHNSIGIQSGSNPATASMEFHWGRRDGRPEEFFRAPDDRWYWPSHGAIVGDELLLFMMLVRSPVGGTGTVDEWRRLGSLGFFDVFGWAAFAVSNPEEDPSQWDIRLMTESPGPIALGASVVADDGWLLAFGCGSDQSLSLARWPIESGVRGVVDEPEWWTSSGWQRGAEPAIVIEHGVTEFTVHRDPHSGLWLQTQMVSSRGDLAVRRAERLQGPWSDQEIIFTPEESRRPNVFVYAGKAHPHLTGADLVLTYASIAEADETLADPSIYYPRFVRATMEL